ncbi:hypothetical protein VNO77_18619 [Canavalia gladiata]|uniref:Uncharacterized protein n=1 Tax=Canavalia gladiata TaxID=3824 RepID=A0AAN9LPU3_CANGL
MAEPEKEELESEIDWMEDYEGEEKNGASSHSELPNTSLAELNLLLVLLSLFYSSSDECIEYEESKKIIKDEVAVTKTCVSKLRTKRREKHEPKLGRRTYSSRFQTTVRDSRHGRKM